MQSTFTLYRPLNPNMHHLFTANSTGRLFEILIQAGDQCGALVSRPVLEHARSTRPLKTIFPLNGGDFVCQWVCFHRLL